MAFKHTLFQAFACLHLGLFGANGDSISRVSFEELISRSEHIVLVECLRSTLGTFEPPSLRTEKNSGKPFLRQTTLRVIKCFKGTTSGEIQVYDKSGRADVLFDPSQVDARGRYVVFLIGDNGFLTGTHGYFSSLKIEGSMAEAYGHPHAPSKLLPLDRIMNQITEIVTAQGTRKP